MPIPVPDENTPADSLDVLLANIVTAVQAEIEAQVGAEAAARIEGLAQKVALDKFKVQQADPGHSQFRVWVSWV
jgi:hypothetical protein